MKRNRSFFSKLQERFLIYRFHDNRILEYLLMSLLLTMNLHNQDQVRKKALAGNALKISCVSPCILDIFPLSIFIIYPISPSRKIKIHNTFRACKLTGSTFNTSLIIMLDQPVLKGEPLCRTKIKTSFFITFTASARINFYMFLAINFKAYQSKPFFDTDIHSALIPFNISRNIIILLSFDSSSTSSNALFFGPFTRVSL